MRPLPFLTQIGPEAFFYLIIAAVVVWNVWWIISKIEVFFFIRPKGSVKRGIGIGSEPMSLDQENFFRYLPDGVLDDSSGAFIKKADNAVLVQNLPAKGVLTMLLGRRASLPCVAYIDLNGGQPRIEYRIPVSPIPGFGMLTAFMILWWIGFAWDAPTLLLPLLFLAIGPWIIYHDLVTQKKRILALISEKMQAYSAARGTATVARPMFKF